MCCPRCEAWEQALVARLQDAEQVVARACTARHEAKGQLALSRARQSANEACLAVRVPCRQPVPF